MKKIPWIFAALLCIHSAKLHAQATSSFNFSAAAQTVSGGWINVSGDPSVAVRTATDASTGITISSVATANWVPNNSVAAFNGGGQPNGTFFPAAVMNNHWFQDNPFLSSYNAAVPQLEISGLNVNSVYSIKMTGSYSSLSYDFNPTRYTVAGATVYGYQDLNSNLNVANGVTFHNIAPDATGVIKVYVNPTFDSQAGDICGLVITSGSTVAPVPVVSIIHPANNDVIPEDGNIGISVNAVETGGTIVKVEFYAGSTKIGEATTSPYNFTWSSPDAGDYTITARAIDGVGNIGTASVNVSVESLSSFWSTTGNIATGGDTNFIGTVDTNRLAFRTNNVERMSILGDGSIGIGTKNTYGYKLAVNGNAIFTKVRIKTAGTWPDYVFKKGYVLLDLRVVEQYILENKHLPGIVSEREVSREGFDIGEHQAALLKKVEELTLYLIEENKRLKEQNNAIAEQHRHIMEQDRHIADQDARLEQQQREIDELRQLLKGKVNDYQHH
ncbi:MAG TPA: Ig-like domain-containing protein [Puia sp.]|jgi:hypothetical protein